VPQALVVSQLVRFSCKLREVPFDTFLVDLVPRCPAFGTTRYGFGLGSRESVSDDVVYCIFAIFQSQGIQSPNRRTQNELCALGDGDSRSPQMLTHLHPTKQEAGIQIKIHATRRVQFEVAMDRADLIFRQPEKS
jgi:hypothetical protein